MGVYSKIYKPVYGKVYGGVYGDEIVAPFVPTDISNLLAWFDGLDPSTIIDTTTPGLVEKWVDKSGVGNDVIASGASRPTTGVENINGRSALGFDGSANVLKKAAFALTPSSTVFVVYNPIDNTANGAKSIVSFDNVGGNQDYQIDGNTAGSFFVDVVKNGLFSGTLKDPTDRLGQNIITTLIWNAGAGDVKLYTDNSLVDTNLTYDGTMNATMDFMLALNRNDNAFLECNVGEGIVYGKDVNETERQQVITYLTTKWGI